MAAASAEAGAALAEAAPSEAVSAAAVAASAEAVPSAAASAVPGAAEAASADAGKQKSHGSERTVTFLCYVRLPWKVDKVYFP